jgi:hypothetical protein
VLKDETVSYGSSEPLYEANDSMGDAQVVLLPAIEEVRTRNEVTGGEKGVKPERFSLIPVRPMEEVARVYGAGASKYAPRNWERGYEWSKSMDALERHYQAWKRREDYDPESGLHHLAHAVFHCLALMQWTLTHPELDDRAK